MAHNSTKSIDVGSVFLMDLSVNESEFNDDLAEGTLTGDNVRVGSDARRNTIHHQDKSIRLSPTYQSNANQYPSLNRNRQTSIVDPRSKITPTITPRTTQPTSNDYLGSSLDRLASVINCDGQEDDMAPRQMNNEAVRSMVIVQSQKHYDFNGTQSSCSLSDESYVASGETSLSASLAYSSEQEFEDKGSTTTREDSGVLDLKDLEGQPNNGSHEDDHDHRGSPNSSKKPIEQEKSISNNIMATNLINNSAIGNKNFQYQQQEDINYNKQHRSINEPTDGSGATNHYHHNFRSNHSKRSVSASLPIQVPARQMKKKLSKMKLDLMKDEEPAAAVHESSNADINDDNSPVRKGDRNRPAIENIVAFDDDEAFLEQEFNANHHNHYPVDELDREHVTAEDDPMRMLASIQALAKSLHDDSEVFGSLPPKRMLESPIRSILAIHTYPGVA